MAVLLPLALVVLYPQGDAAVELSPGAPSPDGSGPQGQLPDDGAGGGNQGPMAEPGEPTAPTAADGSPASISEVPSPPPLAPAATGTDCRSDGRQKGVSPWMPPCEPLFTGDNGGATAPGVTGTEVVAVNYYLQQDPTVGAATSAAGADDTIADKQRHEAAIVNYYNHVYETYGRRVVVRNVVASGSNDEAYRADAVRIATEIRPFAVWVTTGAPVAFIQEITARGILCLNCGLLTSRTFYRNTGNLIFGGLPTYEDYYEVIAEYIGKRLHGRNARWAGDDQVPGQNFRSQPRTFGLIWLENVALSGGAPDPGAKVARDYFVRLLGRHGASLAADRAYLYDLARVQEQATSIIARLKGANVSTVAFMGDPISLIFFTREATRQLYYPEWLITGTVLIDTTIFGRLQDQQQWRNAFGVSPLFVTWETREGGPGHVEYVYGGGDPERSGAGINSRRDSEPFFIGLQMAGPRLTAETFREGLYRYPPTGGTPQYPLYYYTPDSPTSIKDFTEVFWDPQARGKDEIGVEGDGMLLKVAGGRRYRLGQWPSTDPRVFDRSGTATSSDDPPWGYRGAEARQDYDRNRKCRSCRS